MDSDDSLKNETGRNVVGDPLQDRNLDSAANPRRRHFLYAMRRGENPAPVFHLLGPFTAKRLHRPTKVHDSQS